MSKHIRKVLGLLQHRKQIPPPHQQPTSRTPEEWSAYWKAQSQPWRTEPEIDKKRQEYLAKRRLITPNIAQGIYPFKDIEPKLTRADIEWLLATHESRGMFGPVDWSDESQREREGLDLQGANLRGVVLRNLPLARLHGGLNFEDLVAGLMDEKLNFTAPFTVSFAAAKERINMAAAHLERADFRGAQLQGADFRGAQLQGADFRGAQLQEADFSGAHLQKADLSGAHLQKADLSGLYLQKSILSGAKLQEAVFLEAKLQGADLRQAHLQDTYLGRATLSDEEYGSVFLADVSWGSINLAIVNWAQVKILGDEYEAAQKKYSDGETKEKQTRLDEYMAATRANRQLAVVLRDQGLNEEADRFAYRAQLLQRKVLLLQALWGQEVKLLREREVKEEQEWMEMLLQEVVDEEQQEVMEQPGEELDQLPEELEQQTGLRQRLADLRWRAQKFGQYLFSLFLSLIAGYGYRLWRSFAAYVLVIVGFATAYYLLGPTAKLSLSPLDAIIFSMTSFHGRGFSPGENIGLSNPLTILAALEAFVGLVIEVTLIATLTQRFFGK